MGLFKEHAIAFETIAKKQSRIYNDACDYGYLYNIGEAPQEIKDLIYFANDLRRNPFMQKREAWKNGVTIVLHIGWEIDEGMECGTQYTITFNKITPNHPSLIIKGKNAFISVDVQPYRKPYKN